VLVVVVAAVVSVSGEWRWVGGRLSEEVVVVVVRLWVVMMILVMVEVVHWTLWYASAV
jgi:hypothetical protein